MNVQVIQKFKGLVRRRSFVLSLAAASLGWAVAHPGIAQVDSVGWLEVRQARGQVTLVRSPPKSAETGDRLSNIGDALETSINSSAILLLDEGIGTINVAENTNLRVRRLARLRSGARVTTLALDRGQVRLNIRKFNNQESRLDIKSPAGVAAVRGTNYGISLGRDGRMVVATESGLVTAAALGKTVYLEPNFGSRLRPSEPPSNPRPLDRELWVKLDGPEISGDRLYIRGMVDPLNSVILAEQEIAIDDRGQFEVRMPIPDSVAMFDLALEVRNALGESRRHVLWPGRIDPGSSSEPILSEPIFTD